MSRRLRLSTSFSSSTILWCRFEYWPIFQGRFTKWSNLSPDRSLLPYWVGLSPKYKLELIVNVGHETANNKMFRMQHWEFKLGSLIWAAWKRPSSRWICGLRRAVEQARGRLDRAQTTIWAILWQCARIHLIKNILSMLYSKLELRAEQFRLFVFGRCQSLLAPFSAPSDYIFLPFFSTTVADIEKHLIPWWRSASWNAWRWICHPSDARERKREN